MASSQPSVVVMSPTVAIFRWLFGIFSAIASALFISAVLALFDVSPTPRLNNIFQALHASPLATSLVIVFVVVLSSSAAYFRFRPPTSFGSSIPLSTIIAAGIAGLELISLVAIMSVVVIRPAWCQGSPFCPSTAIGSHDTNLDTYYLAQQSTETLAGAPTTAVETLGSSSPYRVAIGIHSLLQGQETIVIDGVTIHIDSTSRLPQSITPVSAGAGREYDTNVYLATYQGQGAGTNLTAQFQVPFPTTEHVQLIANESDQLDVEVNSTVVADLQFHVTVSYHIAGTAPEHSVTLQHPFTVLFVAA
jgi:hypothetical protein